MKKKRILSAVIALVMALSILPAGSVEAADSDHMIVNQVYGGSKDGYASHSFIELYNPTDAAVDLSGWSLQYKSSADGNHSDAWQKLDLTGTVAAGDYYLIRCGAVTSPSGTYQVSEGDQEWDLAIYNKGFSVVLTSSTATLGDDFAGDISVRTDYVDCLAAQGNDGEDAQKPIAYEGAYGAIQSKKKAVRRVGFADTNNNKNDVTTVDYSKTVSEADGPHKSSAKQPQTIALSVEDSVQMNPGETVALGATAQTALTYMSSNENVVTVDESGTVTAVKAGTAQITISAAEDDVYASATAVVTITVSQGFTLKTDGFENENAIALKKLGSYITGVSNPDGGVAEIVSYDNTNNRAWVVNGATGKLDIVSLNPVTYKLGSELSATSIDVKALVEAKDPAFAYGDMTSVYVNTELGIAAVALQEADYMKDGKVAIMNLEGELLALLNAGCQPDMVTFTPDGTKILVANEGEPRNGDPGNASVDPKGSVTIITLNKDQIEASGCVNVTFDAFDASRDNLTANGVMMCKGAAPSLDLEPEYIACNNNKAYIALQEANAIAVLDLETKQYDGIYSLGYKDLSDPENAADVEDDGTYQPDTYKDTVAAYMPDGITLYEANGTTYLLTANEGDSREWGNYLNEAKVKLTTTSGTQTNKVRVVDPKVTDGLPEGKNVMFGGHSFSIYAMTDGGMTQVYDSANDFEEKTAEYLPSYFNASNDDNDFDSRSQKKGPEPESVTIGTVDGRTYAFVALERIGGIMMYDITNPSAVQYVNYINSRDFAEDPENASSVALRSDVAPEGMYFIDSADSPSGTPILLVAFEVSGTVAAYSVGSEPSEHTEHFDKNQDGICDACGEKMENGGDSGNQNPDSGNGSDHQNPGGSGSDDQNAGNGNGAGGQNTGSADQKDVSQNTSNGPRTGDATNVGLWTALACVALAVILLGRCKKNS